MFCCLLQLDILQKHFYKDFRKKNFSGASVLRVAKDACGNYFQPDGIRV